MKIVFVAFTLVAVAVMLLLILPLAVFAAEMLTHGNIFSITYYIMSNRTLIVNLGYNGSIPLKDFNATLECGGWSQSYYKNMIVRGDVLHMEFNLPRNLSFEKVSFYIEFKINGIYRVKVGVLNVKI